MAAQGADVLVARAGPFHLHQWNDSLLVEKVSPAQEDRTRMGGKEKAEQGRGKAEQGGDRVEWADHAKEGAGLAMVVHTKSKLFLGPDPLAWINSVLHQHYCW